MERVITGQLLCYFVDNRLIDEAQHGFLKGLSSTSNLLYCVNDWTLSLQNRHGVTIIYIDFAKAFDTVSHDKLLYRLKRYGIDGNILLWLRNFLRDRTHCTRVGHCVSEFCDLLSGVIQGSNVDLYFLSRLLTNWLKYWESFMLQQKIFADYLKIYAEVLTNIDIVCFQLALDRLIAWCNDWQMQIAVNKCSMLCVGPMPITPTSKLEY